LKRTTSFLAALALIITLAQPAAAQDAFNPDLIQVPQNSAVYQIGETAESQNFSAMIASSRTGDEQWACVGADDPECSTSKASRVSGEAVLPVCGSVTDENCVVSLELAPLEGEFQAATFVRNATGNTYPEVPAQNFYEQSTPSLWDAPHAPSASGTTGYAVVVRATQSKEPGKSKFNTWRFFASVIPYREDKQANAKSPVVTTVTNDPLMGTRKRSIGVDGHTYECGWSEDGTCGVTQDFAQGTRVKLTIRISNEVGGWFQGRIKDPIFNVKSHSRTNNEISVEAEPAIVNRLHHVIEDAKSITPREKQLVNGFAGGWDGFVTWAKSSTPLGFEYVNYFRSKTKDTSAGKNSFWNFSSSEGGGGGSGCLADKSKVLGIVTTNSMVYDGGVPKFTRGFINYKVAGLHYETDGVTEVIGSYDLVMRSEVARCLYGFSRAPVSATITITGEGDRSIATTVVGERNGWLKLAAYGFTFSQKTIQVRLTQPRRTTITCVSNSAPSRTTKVTGTNPKCPTGFRKR
jgi:hypothetical protein